MPTEPDSRAIARDKYANRTEAQKATRRIQRKQKREETIRATQLGLTPSEIKASHKLAVPVKFKRTPATLAAQMKAEEEGNP